MALTCERCQHENSDEARFCLQCGAMLESQGEVAEGDDAMIGRILLGRYRVTEILGEGGMGKVYLAEQKMGTATRKVAIKTLHPELSGDPQLVARFHRECETVIQLHHPNTVQFYDFGDLEDDTLFIVMEFIEGEDLSKRLERERRLEPGMVDKLLIQICGSLAEAHERGVVHRDLKPENVLLTTRGGQTDFVKLLDFGIAKRSEAEDEKSAKLTKQGMVLGTPPYMSPEQFSGQQLDLRSDIYSLAVMTYEMITGQLPFEARTPWEWATKHLTAQPAPIQQQPGGNGLPDHKAAAIMRGMSKDREARQGSALQFMHELTGIGDAQAAWTMATSTGVGSQTGGGVPRTQAQPSYDTGPQGQHPHGTPGAMPRHATPSGPFQPHAQGGHPYPTPGPSPQHPMHTPTPGPTEFPSGPMQVPTSGGAGKWVAILVVLFMVPEPGAGAGGGHRQPVDRGSHAEPAAGGLADDRRDDGGRADRDGAGRGHHERSDHGDGDGADHGDDGADHGGAADGGALHDADDDHEQRPLGWGHRPGPRRHRPRRSRPGPQRHRRSHPGPADRPARGRPHPRLPPLAARQPRPAGEQHRRNPDAAGQVPRRPAALPEAARRSGRRPVPPALQPGLVPPPLMGVVAVA
jgi:serine/threonine protein kinase